MYDGRRHVKPHDLDEQLAHFVGPMAENGDVFAELLRGVVEDHHHWRRNYFPGDQRLYSARDRRVMSAESDTLDDAVHHLSALLRRSFPFHNPRYVAHQQSETSLPTLLGAIAGLLYNSNNVTSESGNVTLELEFEACAELLRMIGYTPPPVPPQTPIAQAELTDYLNRQNEPFGWCHLNSGGTSANIEALWVARNVRYRAVTLGRVALKLGLDVSIEGPGSLGVKKLADLQAMEQSDTLDDFLLRLRPDATISLFTDLFATADDAGKAEEAWNLFREIGPSILKLMASDDPVILVSGAAHYSIQKAMDVLGLGADSLVTVETDERFRVSPAALRRHLEEARANGRRPLAVVGVIGTTEEGGIDPLNEILEIRSEWETTHGQSFWVHADAAWGGYFLTTLRDSPRDRFADWLDRTAAAYLDADLPPVDVELHSFGRTIARLAQIPEVVGVNDQSTLDAMQAACDEGRWNDAHTLGESFLRQAGHTPHSAEPEALRKAETKRAEDFLRSQRRTATVALADRPPVKVHLDRTVDPTTIHSLASLQDADSVTVDPHKMGYQPYACGAIAFKRDGVRNFVRQQAPYITRATGNDVVQQPPLHLKRITEDSLSRWTRAVDAPALYTLEGSRPSSPATGLWLSTQVLPLHRDGHGGLVRSTWRVAQDLAGWIDQFHTYRDHLGVDCQGIDFDLELLTRSGGRAALPDTNLVIFGATVRGTSGMTLEQYNALMDGIYKRFSISSEEGDDQHSYGQPFFLSRTDFQQSGHRQDSVGYATEAVKPGAEALGISDFDSAYPAGTKMRVLRSTVMNPYLESAQRRSPSSEMFVELMSQILRAGIETWLARPK